MSESQYRWSRAIKRRLDAWDWTQAQMAEHLGVAPQRLNDWCRGIAEPSDDAKAILVKRLGIDPQEVAPDWLRGAISPVIPPAPAGDATEGAA